MIIENVYLNNFTSFKDCYITFSDKINIFVGDDDNAKIDLLKPIYCLDEKFYINKKRRRNLFNSIGRKFSVFIYHIFSWKIFST